jgi:hypothetical protein
MMPPPANLKPGKADDFEWNTTTGLGIKVTPADRKVFVGQLELPRSIVQNKRTIGQYNPHSMTLAQARTIAHDWRSQVKLDRAAASPFCRWVFNCRRQRGAGTRAVDPTRE